LFRFTTNLIYNFIVYFPLKYDIYFPHFPIKQSKVNIVKGKVSLPLWIDNEYGGKKSQAKDQSKSSLDTRKRFISKFNTKQKEHL